MSTTEIDAEYDALHDDLTSYLAEGGQLAVVKAPPGSGKTFTLVRVLADYRFAPQGVYAMYPDTRHLPLKVRAFIDFMKG